MGEPAVRYDSSALAELCKARDSLRLAYDRGLFGRLSLDEAAAAFARAGHFNFANRCRAVERGHDSVTDLILDVAAEIQRRRHE